MSTRGNFDWRFANNLQNSRGLPGVVELCVTGWNNNSMWSNRKIAGVPGPILYLSTVKAFFLAHYMFFGQHNYSSPITLYLKVFE